MLSRLMVISRLSSDALLRITDLSSDALQNFVTYSLCVFPLFLVFFPPSVLDALCEPCLPALILCSV